MTKARIDYKAKHRKAVKMFTEGKTIDEVAAALNVARYRVAKWHTGFNKLQKHNFKQHFKTEFADGRKTITELANLYGLERRTVLKWKHKFFGKGNLRQRLMFQMFQSGIPRRCIARFYDVHIQQVHTNIKRERQNREALKVK